MSGFQAAISPAQVLHETAGEFHAMTTAEHLHTPHSHASPAPHAMGQQQAVAQAHAHAAAHAHAHAAAQAQVGVHAHSAHATSAAGAGAGTANPEDFMHPYMQSILGMLHNELADKNLQLKSMQDHLQDYKVLKYMSKQTERESAKAADEVRTCKNEINNLRKQLAAERQARVNAEQKYAKVVKQIAAAKRAASSARGGLKSGQSDQLTSGMTLPSGAVEPGSDATSSPEPNSGVTEPQTELVNKSTAGEVTVRADGSINVLEKKTKSGLLDTFEASEILKSIVELQLDDNVGDDILSPRLPTLLDSEGIPLSIDLDTKDSKRSGQTGSTTILSGDLGSGASGLLSPSPTSGNHRTTAASGAGGLPSSTSTTIVDLTYMTATGSNGSVSKVGEPVSSGSVGSRADKPHQNEMHGVISTWGRKVCKGRIRPTSSAEFANYEFSFDLQDVDPEVEATFYIGDPVIFVALRGYNELRAVNVRLAKPRIGLPPAIFPTNNYFYYIYDIPVTNLSNIDAKLKHELKTRQVMTEYDLLDCYLKVVGQAFHENNITYFGIVSFSEVESYKNFFKRLAECNANETDPAKKPPMKVGKTRPRGRLEFW